MRITLPRTPQDNRISPDSTALVHRAFANAASGLPGNYGPCRIGRMPLESGKRLGNYEIQGLLGVGGMGEVYRAKDLRLDREVA